MKDETSGEWDPWTKPALVAALLASAVAAAAALAAGGPPSSVRRTATSAAPSGRALAAPCPPGTLPDEGVCIPAGAPRPAPRAGAAEGIPRRPDRPLDYARYVLPVSGGPPEVLDESTSPPTDGGAALSGVRIRGVTGAGVVSASLDGEVPPARLVYAGPLVGASAVTLHRVREHDRERSYLVVVGRLDAAPALAPHAEVPPATPLGHASGTPLHLDVRRVRPGVDVFSLSPHDLLDDASGVSEDPRNVLALTR